MVVCSNCGATNQPGVNFCTRCGTRLVAPSAPPVPQVAAPPPSAPPQYPPGQYPPPQGYPSQYPYPVNQPQVKQRSPCGCCFTIFLIFIVLIVGTIGVGWFLLQNGTLTQRGILNAVGMGTGETDIINLTDGVLSVNITTLDGKSDSSLLKTDLTLQPFDSDSFTSLSPGRYRMTFTATTGQATGTCFLQIGSGDVYQFAAVNEGVVITSDKHPANTVEELDMFTSSLCRK